MATGLRQLTERERAIISKYSIQHSPVVGFTAPIGDDDGTISSPLLRLSTLARLEHRGAITRAEAEAGERFHLLFQMGALDGLKAADVSRIAGGSVHSDLSPSHERCRQRVADAVAALGGHGSVAASAIWHVAGLEWSVRRWALSARRPSERACGILIASLAVLASHFAGGQRTVNR